MPVINCATVSPPIDTTSWLSEFVQDESIQMLSEVLSPNTKTNEVLCSVIDKQNSNITKHTKGISCMAFLMSKN